MYSVYIYIYKNTIITREWFRDREKETNDKDISSMSSLFIKNVIQLSKVNDLVVSHTWSARLIGDKKRKGWILHFEKRPVLLP